jgi:hypothetical protein
MLIVELTYSLIGIGFGFYLVQNFLISQVSAKLHRLVRFFVEGEFQNVTSISENLLWLSKMRFSWSDKQFGLPLV